MSESTDLHRQIKLPFDINVIWREFKTVSFFLLVHINVHIQLLTALNVKMK